MGWAFGEGRNPRTGNRRPIGYGVIAKCDEPRCKARIDRGLAYLCGGLGGAYGRGCGGYFCHEHRRSIDLGGERMPPHEEAGERCPSCWKEAFRGK